MWLWGSYLSAAIIIMHDGIIKLTWQQFCFQLELFHLEKVANTRVLVIQGKAEKEWSLRDTAKVVNRSVGKVSEDLRLAKAMRIWPKIETCPSRAEALVYMLKKEDERDARDRQAREKNEAAKKEAAKWRPKVDPEPLI